VADIPVATPAPDNLTLQDFSEIKHIADGSNANVFLAKFLGIKYLSSVDFSSNIYFSRIPPGEAVVIKMIKEDVQADPVAVHEFDIEHGILSRLNHPYIIKLVGAGRLPRRFIVLEYLGRGSLNTLLTQNQVSRAIKILETNLIFLSTI